MSSSYRRSPLLAAGCACLGLMAGMAGSARAETAPSFEELVEQIDRTPSSQLATALKEAADARVRQAAVRPNPVVGIETDNVLGSGPYSGFSNSETTLSVSQNLELWGRRPARVGAARAEAGAAALRRDVMLADSIGRLASAYVQAEAAQRRYELAEETLELTLADTLASQIQVEEGLQPRLRGIQAESAAAAAKASRDEALAEMEAAFAQLTVTAMLPAPVTGIEAGLLDRKVSGRGADDVEVPAIQVAEAERLTAERRITLERSLGRPDITANFGVRQSQLDNATALTFGFSLPLPLFDQNRGNIQAAEAELRASTARLEATRQETRAAREAAVARMSASDSRVAAADAGVESADEAYRLSRIGFDTGRISQLELLSSRAALVSARTAAVDARQTRAEAEIELARLEGRIPFGGTN